MVYLVQRFMGSRVKTDKRCSGYCSRSGIPGVTHGGKRLYNQYENRILFKIVVWGFPNQNVEPQNRSTWV
jgi:hypothetical protein